MPEVGEALDYHKVYSVLSLAAHSAKLSQNLLAQNNGMILAPNYNDLLIPDTFLAMFYHSKIIRLMLDYFHVEDKDNIVLFLDMFVMAKRSKL